MLFILVRRGEIAKPSPAVLAWLALGVWMGVSGFWALDTKAWLLAYLTFGQLFLLYALLALMIATKEDIRALCTAIVVGGMSAAAFAIGPFIHGFNDKGRLTLPGGNPHDPVDPNQFAAALLLPFAILFATALWTKKPAALVFNISGLALIAITIVLTGSRAAMLSLVVLVVFMAFRSRHRILAFGLLALSAVAVVPFALKVQERFSSAISSGGAGREDIWKVALIALKQHWLFGAGFASFPAAYDSAVLQAPLQMYVGWHRAPHNLVIATSVELGIVGIALVILALFLEYRNMARLPLVGGFMDELRVAFQATLLAICLDALFLDLTNRKYLWLLLIMIALLRSTVLNVAESRRDQRRTMCVATSLPIPDPTSDQPKLNESPNLLQMVG
jgi:O-antigen ligase